MNIFFLSGNYEDIQQLDLDQDKPGLTESEVENLFSLYKSKQVRDFKSLNWVIELTVSQVDILFSLYKSKQVRDFKDIELSN